MPVEFRLPEVVEGVTEGTLVEWRVRPGDTVANDQVLAAIETDKAVVDLPSPVDGVVRELLADPGDVVPVGEVIATFDVEDATSGSGGVDDGHSEGETDTDDLAGSDDGATVVRGGRVFAPPSVRRLARKLGVDVEAVAGSGPGGRPTPSDVRAAADAADGDDPGEAGAATTDDDGLTPAVSAIESDDGDDAEDEDRDRDEDGDDDSPGHAGGLKPAVTRIGSDASSESDQANRVVYGAADEAVGRSISTAPFTTHHDSVVVTDLVDASERLAARAGERGVSLTPLPLVMGAVVAALKDHPILNASLDGDSGEILYAESYDLGVATATDDGLVVSVVRDVDEKGVLELASETNELVADARDRSISREETGDRTFTVTDFGAVGDEYATPTVDPPGTAVLGLGAIRKRPVVLDREAGAGARGGTDGASGRAQDSANGRASGGNASGRASGRPDVGNGSEPSGATSEVVARDVLTLSLSVDPRVVDGAQAARFLETLKQYLRDPTLLLLE